MHVGDSPAFSVTAATPTVTEETTAAGLGGTFYVHYDQETETDGRPPQRIPRGVSHKTRLFGQSHWVSPTLALVSRLFPEDSARPVRRGSSLTM